MTRFSTRRQGFTIIEIIVVIAIILILAAITMVGYVEMQDRIIMSEKRQIVTTIHNKMKRFYSLKGHYPTAAEVGQLRQQEAYFLPLVQAGKLDDWPCANKKNVCLAYSDSDYVLNTSVKNDWTGSWYGVIFWDSEKNYWAREELFNAPLEGYTEKSYFECGREVNGVDGHCNYLKGEIVSG